MPVVWVQTEGNVVHEIHFPFPISTMTLHELTFGYLNGILQLNDIKTCKAFPEYVKSMGLPLGDAPCVLFAVERSRPFPPILRCEHVCDTVERFLVSQRAGATTVVSYIKANRLEDPTDEFISRHESATRHRQEEMGKILPSVDVLSPLHERLKNQLRDMTSDVERIASTKK